MSGRKDRRAAHVVVTTMTQAQRFFRAEVVIGGHAARSAAWR